MINTSSYRFEQERTYQSQIKPGITYRTLYASCSHGTSLVNVLDVDLNRPQYQVRPVVGKEPGLTPMRKFATPNTIALFNGFYFRVQPPFLWHIIGTFIQDGKIISGSAHERSHLTINNAGKPEFRKFAITGQVNSIDRTGKKHAIPLQAINQFPMNRIEHEMPGPYLHLFSEHPDEWHAQNRYCVRYFEHNNVLWNEVVLFNSDWKFPTPELERGMRQIWVKHGIAQPASDKKPIKKPSSEKDGVILIGPIDKLKHIKPGDRVDIQIDYPKDVRDAVGVGPMLVEHGHVRDDKAFLKNWEDEHFLPQRKNMEIHEPRTATGYTRNGHFMIVTVDGRDAARQDDTYFESKKLKGSHGISLPEMAHLMKALGAVEALNMDGGSSTQMMLPLSLRNQNVWKTQKPFNIRPLKTAQASISRISEKPITQGGIPYTRDVNTDTYSADTTELVTANAPSLKRPKHFSMLPDLPEPRGVPGAIIVEDVGQRLNRVT